MLFFKIHLIHINSQAILTIKKSVGHYLFDTMRLMYAQEKRENRLLTVEELTLIEDLTEMSKIGYNKAFKRSCPFNVRIGVYGICIKDNNVLMVKTIDSKREVYNFPGGGIEHDESLATCLKRECREEIGCEIAIGNLYATSPHLYYKSYYDTYAFNIYYAMTVQADVNPALEGATWIPIDAMPLDTMLESDIYIASLLKKQYL